jgi:predicted nucleotidyltransferase
MNTLAEWPPELVAEAIEKARQILASAPGVRRAWLFGSVARGDRLDWLSDLDLAVEGLPSEMHPNVWAQLENELRCPVDLVRLEEASVALKQQVEDRGRLIHEA